ncbi:MAG: hypothetical protein WBA51_12490 [Erythrobacter sp.]
MSVGLAMGFGLAFAVMLATGTPASAETREEYLARLKDVCEVECLQPRTLLRTARKRGSGDKSAISGILDVRYVSRLGDKFRLHSEPPRMADFWDLQQLNFGMPEYDGRSVTNRNDIIVEFDQQTLFDLLNVPTPAGSGAPASGANDSGDDDILVEGDRNRTIDKPSLKALSSLLRNRRVVVRGTPRLTPSIIGARRDFRRKQLTIELGNADDLVLIPRFDQDGNPLRQDVPWLNEPAKVSDSPGGNAEAP